MKNIVIIALLTISSLSFAQTQNNKYGPKAKNQRIWVNKSNKSQMVTNNNEQVTGGKAKNNQVWVKNYNQSEMTIVTSDEDKMALKGPNAKNYKPHMKYKGTEMNSGSDQKLAEDSIKINDPLNKNILEE